MVMSEEERRAKNAAKQRAYRARKAAEREATKAAAGNGPSRGPAPTTMRDAVSEAIASMKWLVPSDVASKTQALELARQIDELEHEGERMKALSAHRALSRVLSDLGGTPSMRMQRELRSLKNAPKPEGDDDSDATPTPDNVTKLKRPAKRRA